MTEQLHPMQTHRTPDLALWDHWRALREQWTHEDNLVHARVTWLILSNGLLFTAYGAQFTTRLSWLTFGFPFFGMAVAMLIGIGIFTAMSASEEIQRQFDLAGLVDLCALAPASPAAHRGRWAAKALPFVFGGLWLLALTSSLQH
jgi:hypothetical protein